MSRFDLDWRYMLRHTSRPAVCCGLAILSLCIALWMHADLQKRYAELTANQDAVQRDYNALVARRRLVARYHRTYQRFSELGFIGRESRLDWIESLRTTMAALQLPTLSYSIEPQVEVLAPVTTSQPSDEIQIRLSQMQLEISLVHELDLLRFFDVLQSHAPGLIKVDRCDLTFVGDSRAGTDDTNLTAKCAVQIYSVITSDVSREVT